MDALVSLLHAVSAAAASALVMGVAEGIALTACVAVVLWLCPGLSAGMRSLVWTAALGMSVALPVGSLMMGRDGAAGGSRTAEVSEGWALALVGLWAVLSAVRLAMLGVSAVRLRQVWRRAVPVETGAGCRELLRAGGRWAELCVSADVDRPSVVGFLRPRVLLPAGLSEELRPEEMEHIVRHEMEHLGRRDDWTNLVQKVSLAVFPLNPVLFWLDRRLCRERELACDDGVLRRTQARKAYAACLTGLAEGRMARRGSVLMLGAWGRETELSRRVHRILGWREGRVGRRSAATVAGALMLGMAAGGVWLARCPELVRFTGGTRISAAGSGPRASGLVPPMGQGAPRMMPVMARGSEADAFQPRLVNAVMRAEGSATGTTARAAGRRHRALRVVAGGRPIRQVPVRRRAEVVSDPRGMTASRVVMTGWRDGEEFPARLVLAVSEDGQPRYAAFATRDGWLFVSL